MKSTIAVKIYQIDQASNKMNFINKLNLLAIFKIYHQFGFFSIMPYILEEQMISSYLVGDFNCY
jgi:hypothetical protein